MINRVSTCISINEDHEGPIRGDAFQLKNERKKELIAEHFREIMNILGLDLDNDSLRNTPERVAKMYVEEIFSGMNPENKPTITLFENDYKYNEMLMVKDISFYSTCEHHFLPIIGKVHMAYFSAGTVIGLSKINRLIKYFTQRPQVQERLTNQIAEGLKEALKTEDVAVLMEANHLCVASRGIKDSGNTTSSSHYSGRFQIQAVRNEFHSKLNRTS